jgi:anti-sigma regulatory factor (Ser/Thr protein kinase)
MSADSASPSSADSTSPVHHFKTFEALHDQVREARRFLARLLDGCPVADEAILVLSELATNCVVHSASSEPGGKFTITTEICNGDYVRIEARDQGQCHGVKAEVI